MPSDWISEPKDSGWLDKKPLDTPPLKPLTDIGIDRQKASEAPKPEPIIEPIVPIEAIPYDKVINDLENASNDVLASFSRLGKGSVNLSRIAIVVSGDGPKGKALLDKVNGFKDHIDGLCLELNKMSEDIAAFKNSLPKDNESKI
jgi:hypothetical protein